MPENAAAWLMNRFERCIVGPAPYTTPRANEIVIRNHALAVNPVDYIKQRTGDFLFSWIRYPFILGEDIAGEVAEIGTNVTAFCVGDRVLAHATGIEKTCNSPEYGAFQRYTAVHEHMATRIPDSMRYEDAAVLPLGISTAAAGLFQHDQLGLSYPSLTAQSNGKIVVIWGGSTSVGCNAVQLASAAGYTVIATASPKNFEYVRLLGASHVFDYADSRTVDDIRALLRNAEFAGALAIGAGSGLACMKVARGQCGRNAVAMVSYPVSFEGLPERPSKARVISHVLPQMVPASIEFTVRSIVGGVRTAYVIGDSLMHNEVSRMLYGEFLPKALAGGSYTAAPSARIVGDGLHAVQPALDKLRAGVSAQKLVVVLE